MCVALLTLLLCLLVVGNYPGVGDRLPLTINAQKFSVEIFIPQSSPQQHDLKTLDSSESSAPWGVKFYVNQEAITSGDTPTKSSTKDGGLSKTALICICVFGSIFVIAVICGLIFGPQAVGSGVVTGATTVAQGVAYIPVQIGKAVVN